KSKMISFFLSFLLLNSYSQSFSDSKINLTLDKNSRVTRTYLTYSFKFSSFSDFLSFYSLPLNFYKDISNINLRDSVRFKYYGYSTYPFRYFISKKKKIEFNGENGSDSTKSLEVKNDSRVRLSLSPLIEDVKENTNWYLFDLTVKNFSEEWKSLEISQKKEFLKDLSYINFPFVPSLSEEKSSDTVNSKINLIPYLK
ncbi:MAG TPA: hypothetical protein PK103_08890, partial [Elusimicrobiales bacterium]|nr:hypothetical protein [Elusimicrobiales bacterium]